MYGGSFNPPTLGHYHMIEKATSIFDIVYVVIAPNAGKGPSDFTVDERLAMLKDMAHKIDRSDTKISVVVLPPHTYLADYAAEKGAKFLIRGIRDQLDFGYEQNIYRTNRRIQPKVETIYLMPDDAYSLVSSSWVRNLVGCKGWTKVIENAVTPFVLKELERIYLKKVFLDLTSNPPFSHLLKGDPEVIWGEIEKGYGPKKHHTYSHLIMMLEALEKFVPNPDPFMKYAIFFHDVDDSEDKSAEIATSHIRMVSRSLGNEDIKDKISRLIKATKHHTCEYEKEDEQIITSLDLLILAQSYSDYESYIDGVRYEYLLKSGKTEMEFYPLWIKGRSDFLKKMLERKTIFPWPPMYVFNEDAKYNMQQEYADLNKAL
jgi:pantetheine-phosphate adenylyltransferase